TAPALPRTLRGRPWPGPRGPDTPPGCGCGPLGRTREGEERPESPGEQCRSIRCSQKSCWHLARLEQRRFRVEVEWTTPAGSANAARDMFGRWVGTDTESTATGS